MYSRILVFLFVVSLMCIYRSEGKPVVGKARQFIPALPGYVPVYIRAGDTPLEDINPDLAAAFESYALKHNRLTYGRAQYPQSDNVELENSESISSVGLDEDNLENHNAVNPVNRPTVAESQHIQKIPRN